jgi:heme exporter protein A
MAILLEAKQLTRRIHGRLIIDRVDLCIAAGEIVVVRGLNGAGKTTLLRCLAGCLRPTSGQVRWLGIARSGQSSRSAPLDWYDNPSGPSKIRLADGTRNVPATLVGFVGHESFLYGELSVRENLLFAARMHGVTQPAARVAELLSDCGLHRWAEQRSDELSQGMRRRLSIARAMVHDPPIMILDEPFSALDDGARRWLEQRLAELRNGGHSVCMTGHDVPDRLADRQLELLRGRLHTPTASAHLRSA